MEKIEKGEMFINADIKEKNVEVTILTICESESHMKNVDVHDNEEDNLFIINEDVIKTKRIVVYVNVYNNEIQCHNNMN